MISQNLGKDIRRFSQGDFHKDQKMLSGSSLCHDPNSFALALGSEMDVYRHGLDRTIFVKKCDANSFVEFVINSIPLRLAASTQPLVIV